MAWFVEHRKDVPGGDIWSCTACGSCRGPESASGANQRVGEKAYYSPLTDHIGLPPMGAFPSAVHWSAVAIHEAGHATGAKHRLDHDQPGGFVSEKYAEEEMVAELLSFYVNTRLALPVDTENHNRRVAGSSISGRVRCSFFKFGATLGASTNDAELHAT
jgi:hypothetical protein